MPPPSPRPPFSPPPLPPRPRNTRPQFALLRLPPPPPRPLRLPLLPVPSALLLPPLPPPRFLPTAPPSSRNWTGSGDSISPSSTTTAETTSEPRSTAFRSFARCRTTRR
ncbi:MAG: hypothetical protein D6679_07700 [Candidatus Hydrogenedentota bacterium]|nr:MAG: hypothetical protein D6679_07700 [Candidatus Hydrogenedentota bacterium]